MDSQDWAGLVVVLAGAFVATEVGTWIGATLVVVGVVVVAVNDSADAEESERSADSGESDTS